MSADARVAHSGYCVASGAANLTEQHSGDDCKFADMSFFLELYRSGSTTVGAITPD